LFVQIVSIAVLAVVFLIATTRPINLGALALVATFAVGLLATGEDYKTVISGFPVDVFVLLFGVTYLFGIASVNGTIEWLVISAAKLVRENRAAIPWALFFLAAIPTTAGAAGPAGVALLAPIALRMAERHGINPRLAGLMVVNGSNAGNFSPLNVLGVIVNGTVQRNGLDVAPGWLWLGNFVFTLALGVATFVVFGGLDLVRESRRERAGAAVPARQAATAPAGATGSVGEPADPPATGPSDVDRPTAPAAAPGGASTAAVTAPPTAGAPTVAPAGRSDVDIPVSRVPRIATLVAIVAVAGGALVFDLDIGMLAVTAAVALHLLLPASSAGAMARVSWSTILLICGVVTYVALLQRMGTVKMIGDSVTGISVPLLAALLLCFIAAVTSAFASSIGVLGAMIPLAVPFLLAGTVPVTGVVIALAISATAVDATPFSSIGALTVASAPEGERERLYRGMLRWGFSMVLVAPLATWLLFVVL
jgi:di/tricarboxylate transporter